MLQNPYRIDLKKVAYQTTTARIGSREVYVSIYYCHSTIIPHTCTAPIDTSNSDSHNISGYIYSISGIISEVGPDVKTRCVGMRVALSGISMFQHNADSICVAEWETEIIPQNVTLEQAAFAYLGMYGFNILHEAKLKLGSLITVEGEWKPWLSQIIAFAGFRTPNQEELADALILTFGAEAKLTKVREGGCIISCDMFHTEAIPNDIHLISIKIPSADWIDAAITNEKVVYPYAYVQSTSSKNLQTFLFFAASGQMKVDEWPLYELQCFNEEPIIAQRFIPIESLKNYSAQEFDLAITDLNSEDISLDFTLSDLSSLQRSQLALALAKSNFGVSLHRYYKTSFSPYATTFHGRSMPAVVTICRNDPEGVGTSMTIALSDMCSLIGVKPTKWSLFNKGSTVHVSFADGSIGIVHALNGHRVYDNVSLHWENRTVLIENGITKAYNCVPEENKNINATKQIDIIEEKARVQAVLSLLAIVEENDG